MLYLKLFVLLCVIQFSTVGFAQQKKLIHKARTSLIIPGLRREFKAELAQISIEANPGWQAEEILDSSDHIYQLLFTDPQDSAKKFLSLLVEHYDSKGFDSSKWEALMKSIRISYGDRGIAVRPLNEQMSDKATCDSTGVLANYEILTRHPDFIQYVDAIVGRTSLVLLSAPMKTEEYQQKLPYFRDIAGTIRLQR